MSFIGWLFSTQNNEQVITAEITFPNYCYYMIPDYYYVSILDDVKDVCFHSQHNKGTLNNDCSLLLQASFNKLHCVSELLFVLHMRTKADLLIWHHSAYNLHTIICIQLSAYNSLFYEL